VVGQKVRFIDSHCHFDFADFDLNRDETWQICKRLGLSSMLVPGVSPQQWASALACCQSISELVFSVGLHPWWIAGFSDELEQNSDAFFIKLFAAVKQYALQPQCVAIGECGLDKSIKTPLALQQRVLEAHLQWCSELNLPVILHCVKAHAELLQTLKKHPVPRGGVVHAFSGSTDIAMEYHKLGFCLGAGGVITYERANKTRNAFAALPHSAILLETDAPDMPLSGYQGERNSPEKLPEVAAVLAQLRGETVTEVARYTRLNFQRMFSVGEA